jgi:signal transduction histidine kinase
MEGTVLADSKRIVQVLVNLLSNAIKFSERGGSVTVSAHMDTDRIELSVLDRGRGIPDSSKGTIFDRFSQIEETDATEKSGSGLGLAICKAIVEAHGGEIGVESEPGKGSRFWLKPRAAAVSAGSRSPT